MKTVIRTNITLPRELLRAIDASAKNRSKFLADAAAWRLARERAAKVIMKSAGILKGKKSGKAIVAELRKQEVKRLSALYR